MKEKIILLMLIMIYSSISTPFIKKSIPNALNINEKNIEGAIADDIWDYLSRFSLNN